MTPNPIGTPFISQKVLMRCPSEAEHDQPSNSNRTRKSKRHVRFAKSERFYMTGAQKTGKPAGAQRTEKQRESPKLKKSKSTEDLRRYKSALAGSINVQTSSVGQDRKGFQQETKGPSQKQLTPEAEEKVRILEWAKGLVMDAEKRGRQEKN